MIQISWPKRALSFLLPVVLAKYNSKNGDLKIKFFQGHVQLESENALYSDGSRYAPFRKAFEYLEKLNALNNTSSFLLLGAGLGSALFRLNKVYEIFPQTTLIEKEKEIIALSKEYLLTEQDDKTQFICSDAMDYIKQCKQEFDLIGVDIFDQLNNSELLMKNEFWIRLQSLSHSTTHLIVNTIFNKKEAKIAFEELVSLYFSIHRIDRKPNYFYILKPL